MIFLEIFFGLIYIKSLFILNKLDLLKWFFRYDYKNEIYKFCCIVLFEFRFFVFICFLIMLYRK